MRSSLKVFLFSALWFLSFAMWPQPQTLHSTGVVFYIDPSNFEITSNIPDNDILAEGINRYGKIFFLGGRPEAPPQGKTITNLSITVSSPGKPLNQDTDETYDITIADSGATLTAPTEFGALHGLETFSQLIVFNTTTKLFQTNDWLVYDFPRFKYRGILIDTSRHYLHMGVIFQFLDAMAYNKFNVLHWHIVDDVSFPYVSQKFPRMSQFGAYQPYDSHIYTPSDIQAVIQYGRYRGIRVVPEFDTPAHSGSWFWGYEEYQTQCYKDGKPVNSKYAPINPILDITYMFLSQFFKEAAQTFPDPYLHLGGDELSFDCWSSNPDIQAFMKQQGWGGNYSLLETYYEQKLVNIIQSLDKRYIVWEDVFDNNVTLDARTIIAVWRGSWQKTIEDVTSKGFQTILYSPWYLNYISYGSDWTNYYKVEPLDWPGTPQQKQLVIGGTACFWGEFIDGTNLVARAWPRASAVGERLWSASSVTDENDAAGRISEFRCRLHLRGIPAEPVNVAQPCPQEWLPAYRPPWEE